MSPRLLPAVLCARLLARRLPLVGALVLAAQPVAAAKKMAAGAPEGTFHLQQEVGRANKLRVVSAGGDVRARAQRGSQLVVDGARSLGTARCRADLRRAGDVLELTAQDASGAPCVIDLQLKLPPTLSLELEASSGNVFVSGLRRDLSLKLTQGNAVVGGLFAHFVADLAEGSLSVQGLAGDAVIRVQRGNVQMYVARGGEGPKGAGSRQVEVHVGTGNVTLKSPYRLAQLDVATPAGQLQSSLDTAGKDAELQVHGEVQQGNFTARLAD